MGDSYLLFPFLERGALPLLHGGGKSETSKGKQSEGSVGGGRGVLEGREEEEEGLTDKQDSNLFSLQSLPWF